MKSSLVIFVVLGLFHLCCCEEDGFLFGKFPSGFKWGACTSAYQIEGGWNLDGKGANIWDVYGQQPGHINKNETGDVACDSYHNYKEDVEMLKNLGVTTYRFSISWSRILPTGSKPNNPKGIQYYKNLISELKNASIEPMVTLYHNDLPEQLQKSGGWLNKDIINKFTEYAQVCFTEFGKDVKHWITINEPWNVAVKGYGKAMEAPGVWGPGENSYIAGHNLIKSHVAAYKLYQTSFKASQKGQIGITLNSNWLEPMNPESSLDVAAQERGLQFTLGWFANPLFLNGDYPDVMKQLIKNKTQEINPGRKSRLPTFTTTEITNNKGSVDFLEVSYSSSSMVSSKVQNCNPPMYDCDSDTIIKADTSWNGLPNPSGVRQMLNRIKTKYNAKIYIKNGFGDTTKGFEDQTRIDYLKSNINQALKAVNQDKCNVMGYMIWSLMDNFEWTSGYSIKYGLYQVDFNDLRRPRTARASAGFYSQIIKNNGFINGYDRLPTVSSGIIPYEDQFDIYYGDFPKDFAWGVSSAAFKVEGAWDIDGKVESIWDSIGHKGGIQGKVNGDMTSDQYHHYKQDVKLIKELGVKQYYLSISWSRIFTDETEISYNQKGVDYYQNLIKELKKNQIEPVVTLYYWDMPQSLAKQDGWLNSKTIDQFVDFADFCFRKFGNQVKMWVTMNDPLDISQFNTEGETDEKNIRPYKIGKQLLLAHARVYRLYEKKYKSTQKGQVGISIDFAWAEPSNALNSAKLGYTSKYLQMRNGWFAAPIFGTNGDYPEVMKKHIAWVSRREKLNSTKLPEFTDAEKKLIKGSSDFLGVKYFETVIVKGIDIRGHGIKGDRNVKTDYDPSWIGSGQSWQKVAPIGIRKALNWIKNEYGNPTVYITENGVADRNGSLVDEHRIHYYRTYTNNVLKAINLDGCNVKGYSAMSLIDGIEWYGGYGLKTGFYSVDFADPQRPRTPRASAYWYSLLTKDNGFKPGYPHPGGLGIAPKYTTKGLYDKFPKDFTFSVATAAAQVEGAWNEDGKGPSIWDVFSRAGNCLEHATTEIACDSYHKYKEDIRILKDIGVKAYRFSIAWSRVLPNGLVSSRNQRGVDYYNNVINELIANNIIPMVTIYHWDLPQALQEGGGWLNDSIIDLYRDYAGFLFKEFGDRVNTWITLNEPWVFTVMGHGDGSMAPGFKDKPGEYPYIAAHNAIRSHAAAYHHYHEVYKGKGRIGITLNIDWQEPSDPYNKDDREASEWAIQTFLGWFANPIYVNGDYPDIMKSKIGRISSEQGLPKSRLPEFTASEKRYINGTSDFFGINSYSTNLCEKADLTFAGKHQPNYFNDRELKQHFDPKWKGSGSTWLKVVPWGLRKILNWVKNNYGDREILITENGVSDNTGALDDYDRKEFIALYTDEVLKAIKFDGINVIGYTSWSVMDNFEWARGYTEKFGMYAVDLNSPERTRSPKRSSNFYHNIIQHHGFEKYTASDPNIFNIMMQHDYELYNGFFPKLFSWGTRLNTYNTPNSVYFGRGRSILDDLLDKNFTKTKFAELALPALDDGLLVNQLKSTHVYMSMSWTMMMSPNSTGTEFYSGIVFDTLDDNVDPIVNLFTWDLPEDVDGGWLNEATIDLFVEYARKCFTMFGNKVKYWVTFDEPQLVAFQAYDEGSIPPYKKGQTDDMYKAVHNMIKAHARVYHMYQREFKHTQGGSVGIALSREWYTPKNVYNAADNDATRRMFEFNYGWVADPLFKNGDYPELMKQSNGSRLPVFTNREKELNKGAVDFLGLSHYTTKVVSRKIVNPSDPKSYYNDAQVVVMPQYNTSTEPMINPRGIRLMLREMKKRYGAIPTFISGNGVSDQVLQSHGLSRSEFIKQSTNEILKAIKFDGCVVAGYTYGPLVDHDAWKPNLANDMGLFKVNMARKVPKPAVGYLQYLASYNGYPNATEPTEPPHTTKEPTPTKGSKGAVSGSNQNSTNYLVLISVIAFIWNMCLYWQ